MVVMSEADNIVARSVNFILGVCRQVLVMSEWNAGLVKICSVWQVEDWQKREKAVVLLGIYVLAE